MRNRVRENALIFGIALAIYLAAGIYLAVFVRYLPYDGISRLVSAWLVVYGTEFKLASIGFVWPPIPTLLVLPFVVIPALVNSWMAIVIVSAVFMALATMVVNQLAELCGLTKGWGWVVTILFALNPLMFVFAINGMSEALFVGLTMIGFYWLVKFWQTDRSTYLILTAGFLGLLPLIRYELALITAYAGIILLVLSWRRRSSFSDSDFRDFLEGRLLAYSSLAIYPLFVWSISSWLVMDNPLYYLINDRSALSLAEMGISTQGIITTPGNSFRLTFVIWIGCYLAGFLASLIGLYVGWVRRSGFLFMIALATFLIPLLQFFLLINRATVPLVRYFIMAVPLGVIVILVLVNHVLPQFETRRYGRTLLFGGAALSMLISNVISWRTLVQYPYPGIEQQTWYAFTEGTFEENPNFVEALAVGKLLVETIPPGSKVLMDTYDYGYAILLGAKSHDLFVDFTDPNYDLALQDPPSYVDYILLPRSEGRGALYSVNQEHKKLYEEGASWVEWMDILPASEVGWKLYKVNR